MPPSYNENFKPRKGPLLSKNSGSCPPAVIGPLSLVNTTSVFSES
jgi:hypothetical protein